MSDQLTLAAETRDRAGKGASRALRRDGRVPAVIYGQNKDPESIHLEEKALVRALGTGHFMNTVVMINGQRTLPKDVAFHPVSDRPLHVDFLRISAHSKVTVAVPVHFVDEEESVYLKFGGVLNVVLHEIEVICDAAEIPSEITVSLAGREVGDSIHIGNVTLPKGVVPAAEGDFTVATIVPPTVPTAEDEAADAEVAEAQAAEHEAEVAEAEAAEAESDAEKTDDEGEDKAEG